MAWVLKFTMKRKRLSDLFLGTKDNELREAFTVGQNNLVKFDGTQEFDLGFDGLSYEYKLTFPTLEKLDAFVENQRVYFGEDTERLLNKLNNDDEIELIREVYETS